MAARRPLPKSATKGSCHARLARLLACCGFGCSLVLAGCATGPETPVAAPPSLAITSAQLDRLPTPANPMVGAPVRLTAMQDEPIAEIPAPPPILGPDAALPPFIGETSGLCESTFPLDLTSTMALVSGRSPIVAHAAARYEEAYARLAAAKVLWVPSLQAGVSYNHHDGNYQASNGAIVDVDRSSLQSGLGVGAVGAGTTPIPGVVARFHTADAVFQPRIADQAVAARSHAIEAASNDVLLDGALAYLELLRAEQLRAVASQSEQRAHALAELTAAFANSGQGSQADADRAQTEASIRLNDLARAEETTDVANARLVEVLSLDPYTRIVPAEPTVVPLELMDGEMSPGELLAIGLSARPELGEARHLVCEAIRRYQRERFAPLLPSVVLGVSQSGFGGGLGGTIADTDGRFDFDAIAFWELRNLGFGEHAARDERWSVYEQRQLEEVRLMDRVAREINEAHAQVRSRKRQIAISETAVAAATESHRRNETRIREGEGLPLEVLQSIQALDQAQREYVRAIVDYNAAQFRLHHALGWAIH